MQAIFKAVIHDLNKGTKYTVTSPDQCRDDTDRSAYESARVLQDVVTMGKIIVEPC